MRHDMLKVSTPFERLVHWVMAGSFIILFLTGISIMFRGLGRVLPYLVGGLYSVRAIHHAAGVVFAISLVFAFFMWAKDCLTIDADDIKWVTVAGGYLWKVDKVPEQGKFNFGQKIFYVLIVVFGILVCLSGFVMWTPDKYGRGLVQLSYMVHALSVTLMTIGWLAHWYLGTLANPGGFQAITTGLVSKAYVKDHQPKYYREVIAKQG